MNTSELLVYIFVFLVGYMLFKRCGCRSVEGIVVPQREICDVDDKICDVDDNIWKYIDEDKLSDLNGDLFLTSNQCSALNNLNGETERIICGKIGMKTGTIFDEDVSNAETCKNVCQEGEYWNEGRSASGCLDIPIPTPTSNI